MVPIDLVTCVISSYRICQVKNKFVLLLFLITLVVSVSLSFLYYQASRGCDTKINTSNTDFSVRIKNEKLWQDYIKAIGNCRDGNFTVYVSSSKTPRQARSLVYTFSGEAQPNKLLNKEKEILYTYGISYDDNKREAKIILNFPSATSFNENFVSGSIFYTTYLLFNGETYTQKETDLMKFNDLNLMGLIYEKR